MCFEKSERFGLKHRVLVCDLPCYKVMWLSVDGKLSSHPRNFRYEFGKTYTSDSDVGVLDGLEELEDGVFHSFTDLTRAKLIRDNCHSPFYGNFVVVLCAIPAGTPFWYNNRFHEYASTAIRIERIID